MNKFAIFLILSICFLSCDRQVHEVKSFEKYILDCNNLPEDKSKISELWVVGNRGYDNCVISGFDNLETLTVNSFDGDRLPVQVNYSKLENLTIVNCKNLNFNKIINNLNGEILKSITIQSSNLQEIEFDDCKWSSLKLIDLNNNSIERFKLKDFYQLEQLHLENNKLSYIEIENLNSIKLLDLSGNDSLFKAYNYFEEFIRYLEGTNIEILMIEGCHISQLPKNLQFQELRILDIRNNNIVNLSSSEISPKIELINLVGNPVEHYPHNLEKFIKLN